MTDLVPFSLSQPLVIGFGITGQAVVQALLDHGYSATVVDDQPSPSAIKLASKLGIKLVVDPDQRSLAALVVEASVLLPSPGVPDRHPVFAEAERVGLVTLSEFDLAQHWDNRPLVAITGTNGKTTVTMMVTDALQRSGIRAAAVGNTELPLVQAIADPTTDVFVVEASSFRLGHSRSFRPAVATWLNFSPDHLDSHASLEDYRLAKASIWSDLEQTEVAVANVSDVVVWESASGLLEKPDHPQIQTFGSSDADWHIADDTVVGPDGPIIKVSSLPRRQPHDLDNATAAAATARAAGATIEGISNMLASFSGLPHRLALVGESAGVRWFDDSKATVPQATVVAVSGFDSVVLLAGGRNKGLDLSVLQQCVPPVKLVIALGDSAQELVEVFEGLVEVQIATDMADAVERAAAGSSNGDVVVLSPACTSFDWYTNYEERGIDFVRRATERLLL